MGATESKSGERGGSGSASTITRGNVSVALTRQNSEKGDIPTHLHIFPPCSKFFCGRADALREVKQMILCCEYEENCLKRIVAIVGFGGMGKSEIAKVVAKELQSRYDYVFWFDAKTKASLESDFKHLASILRIPLTSEGSLDSVVLCMLYRCLAENYRNGMFIFDDAQALRAENGGFSLEEYLLPDFRIRKPVFLVTSRNPMNSECDEIKCVRVNQLSDEDSQQCMLKYLGIENQSLPTSLREVITSLVRMLDGHPLGLTLIGQDLAFEAESICLDRSTIESTVRSYVKLLQYQWPKDLPGQYNYEAKLQQITDWTIEKFLKQDKGKIATELLNIVALLSPDDIHAGLVNGIYCEKPFETHRVLCPKFVWDDLETTVRSGLKLLLSSSLLKIERKAYGKYGYQYKYDMIKIHRLIQQSAQNRLIRLNKTMEPLEKILRFTEKSLLNRDHVDFLLEFFLRNRLAYLHPETCSLQIIGMHLEACHGSMQLKNSELLDQVRDVLRTKKEKFHPDCRKAFCLFETYLDIQIHTAYEDHFNQLKRSIMELSPEFSKQRWLLWLVMQIVDKLHDPDRCLPQDAQRRAYLAHWVLKRYIDGKYDSRRDLSLTEFVRRHGSNRNKIGIHDWSEERELLSKSFYCTSEGGRGDFWSGAYWIIVNSCLLEERRIRRAQALGLLTFPGTISFSRSLQFSQDSFKYWFIINIHVFLICVELVAEYPELRASLLATEGFVSSLWDLTEFGFRKLSSSWEYMNNVRDTWCFEEVTEGLGRLLDAWCNLFVHDVDLYRSLGGKLDSEVENLLGCPWDKKSIYKLSFQLLKHQSTIKDLAAKEHCSTRTRNWIPKLMEYAKQCEEARSDYWLCK